MTEEQEHQIRVLWEETPQSGAQIGARFGVDGSTIRNLATRRKWVSFNPPSGREWPLEQEEHIRFLWEETPQTAVQIAAATGLTKNAIVGVAHRRQWISFNGRPSGGHPAPRTIFGRLDALNAKLDRVLAETEPAIRCGRAADAETLRAGERGGPVVG